jgi:MFS family permease
MEQSKYEVSGWRALATLLVISFLAFMSFADRSIMAVALEQVKLAFKLSDSQVGLVGSLTVAGISILTLPCSILGDRWSRRKMVMVMALFWSIFTLTTGLALQFWFLVVSRFMVGVGEAGYLPAGSTWLSVSFPKEKRGMIMSVFIALSQVGAATGLILGGLLISLTNNWRTPFFVFAIPGIILGIMAFFLKDYKVVKEEGEAILSISYFKNWVTIFKVKSFWLNTTTSLLLYFALVPTTIWMPTLLMRAYQMDSKQAGLTYGLLMFIVLLAPLGGFLADRWQKRHRSGRPYFIALTAFMALSLKLVTFLNVGEMLPLFLTIFSIASVFISLILPVGLTITNDVITPGLRSTAVGLYNFIAQIIGSTGGTIFVGAVSDKLGGGVYGLQWGLISTLPIAALSIVASLIMARFYSVDSAKISDELLAEK